METKNKKAKIKKSVIVAGFDAIKTMREIRDKMSIEIMNMTYDQERVYLDKLLSSN